MSNLYSVTKKFQVEYAHRLIHLPEGHKCRNLHGHSGVVTIECFARNVKEDGFVMDFGDFKPVKEFLDLNFDHCVVIDQSDIELKEICEKLNTRHVVFPICSSSSENLAKFVHDYIIHVYKPRFIQVKVTWSETQNNFAMYTKEV